MLSKDNVYSPVMQIAYELISLAQNDETTDQELFAKLEDIDENNIQKVMRRLRLRYRRTI